MATKHVALPQIYVPNGYSGNHQPRINEDTRNTFILKRFFSLEVRSLVAVLNLSLFLKLSPRAFLDLNHEL